jgi:ABC-2 type transport system permease protein
MIRIRNKSFIIVTLLTPILLSLLFLLPTYFAKQHENYKQIKIGLSDPSDLLQGMFDGLGMNLEQLENKTFDEIKNLVLTNQMDGVIYISGSDSTRVNIRYYSSKQPSLFLQGQIKSAIQKVILNKKLIAYGIDSIDKIIRFAEESISIETVKVSAEKSQTINNQFQTSLCTASGLTIYLFIFLFSSQVMRSVLEEKSSRIVELIITSISPVKFMTGKIIGIALLGLTQLVCWLVIMCCFIKLLSHFADLSSTGAMNNIVSQRINPEDISKILSNLNQVDFSVIIPAFAFFFICGYLLYSSIFAAIAAAANHSDDIQQVNMIVTIPLILSVIVLSNIVNSPDSSLSYWFSIVPFTSPIVMMGRIVYGAPVQDILISMLFLMIMVGIIICLSGKVYKATILYRGKKVTYAEIISLVRNVNN